MLRPGGRLLFADEWWTEQVGELTDAIAAAGLTIVTHEDLTAGIIEALRRMPAITGPLVAAQEGAQRRVYERFFGERVLRDSLESYTSKRFVFTLVVAELA